MLISCSSENQVLVKKWLPTICIIIVSVETILLFLINCNSYTESLLESELFGYEQGAFTGATKSKRGMIETANTGTLFMDEIGDLNLLTQVKLLRTLEQKNPTSGF